MPNSPRERLAEKLRAEGFDIVAEDLIAERGFLGRPAELMKWHAWADRERHTYHLMSPNTMTECAKGFEYHYSGSEVILDAIG